MFEIQRLCYPLLNNDGVFRRENLIVIMVQPLFILIDLIALPFIIMAEMARTKIVLMGCNSAPYKALSILPNILGTYLTYTMAKMMLEPERCIAENMVIDPRRRFWYPYLEYYMLVLETEHGQLTSSPD
jgi:hypothetical protein